jgi:iron complex outermembrane receptor protein
MVEQRFKKIAALSWRLQGTLKQAGNTKTPHYYLKNTGLKEYNFSYNIGWHKEKYAAEIFYSQFNTTLGIFSGSHIGNLTDLQAAFSGTEPIEKADFSYEIMRPYQHIEHELFKMKTQINTGTAGKLSLTYARQYNMRYEYDKHQPLNDSLATLNLPELKFEITTHTADVMWEHSPFKSLSGSLGISTLTQGNTYEGRFFIPNFRNYVWGLFWIERWKKNKVEVEAGIRYDYKHIQVYKYDVNNVLIRPTHSFSNLSGTVGAIYKINPHIHFSMNVGNAWRAPGVNELYSNGLHHGAASIEIGNETLSAEKAYTVIASVNYHDHKKLQCEAAIYYHLIHDFIYVEPTLPPTLTIKGAFPTFYYKQADATLKGLDLMANYELTNRITLSTKASLLRAWNKTANNYLILMPADRYEWAVSYHLKDFKTIQKPYLSASANSILKQGRVPENNDYVPPPSGYTLLNATMGFEIKTKSQSIVIGMSANNLLNTVYRDYLNRFRYYCDGMGRNISVRIKVPFNINPK